MLCATEVTITGYSALATYQCSDSSMNTEIITKQLFIVLLLLESHNMSVLCQEGVQGNWRGLQWQTQQ